MNNEKKYFCGQCQEMTNHKTSQCPTLICKKCKKSGHAQKDCREFIAQNELWEADMELMEELENQQTSIIQNPVRFFSLCGLCAH